MLRKISFLFLFLMLAANTIAANDSRRHIQVDTMDIYLGIMPAQLIQEHKTMHKNNAYQEHKYHVLIALFDKKTGKRITDATLKATVSQLGMGTKTKALEPMREEALSYGNFFILPEATIYKIKVQITRPGKKEEYIANFIYERPKD